jgi:hypothetical protein
MKSLLPASRQVIEALNGQITAEFSQGTHGLRYCNHRWLAKPLAHVLGCDKVHKTRWLTFIDLARERFVSWQDFTG